MKKILIYILLVIIMLGGCKKVDLPDPMVGTPVFSVNATIDNQPFIWTAGDNDVYLFTEFSKDNLDVYTLTGRFEKDDNCTDDCEEYLSFSIRGNEVTPTTDGLNINEVLIDSLAYSYATPDTSGTIILNGFQYSFQASLIDTIFGSQVNAVSWLIASGNNTENFLGDVAAYSDFGNDSIQVQLNILTNDGCTARIRQTFPNGLQNTCDLGVELEGNINNGFFLKANFNNPIQGGNFVWNGDPNNAQAIFILDSMLVGDSIINLLASHQACEIDMDICFSGVDSFGFLLVEKIGIPKIDYTIQPIQDTITINNLEQLSKVIIEYQDAGGTLFSSKNVEELTQANSTFTISEIEEFEVNENGEKTKKFKVKYDCILENDNGETKNIKGESVIAVAYPN